MIDNRFEYIRNQIIDEMIMENKKSVMTEPTMKNDPKRATGRTTGRVLQALGKSVENPGEEVEFIDHHYPEKLTHLQMCRELIFNIAKKLNLDISVEVKYVDDDVYKVFVKSDWVSPYSQRTPAEEKWKELYGFYPAKRYDAERWEYFQQGFEASQK